MCKTPPPKKFAKKARFVPPSNSELYVYFCNLHHVGMALWTLYTIVFGPRPYLLMTVGMYLYSDMYVRPYARARPAPPPPPFGFPRQCLQR